MIHNRNNTTALVSNKARTSRKVPGLRERLMDDRMVANVVRSDFMGFGTLR